MLNETDLATIRAALRFWQEECAVQSVEAQLAYFDRRDVSPPSFDAVGQLRDRLGGCTLHTVDRAEAMSLARHHTADSTDRSTSGGSACRPAAVLLVGAAARPSPPDWGDW